MKKILLLLTLGLFALPAMQAQDITDAYRYSSEELTGTARYRAMSGAFGALGGDLSAVSINPASSAVFLNNFGTITLDYRAAENSINYNNSGLLTSEDKSYYLNQAGGVLVFDTGSSAWRKFSLGVNYAKTNNFDDNFIAQGSSQNSIDEYFLGYAQGVPLELLETMEDESISDLYSYLGETEGFGAQQAFLGYQGYIIDPESEDPQNTSYNSAIVPGNFNQDYALVSTGLNGKFSFNLASQYEDFLYLGANLNTHFLNYDRSTQFIETNSNSGSGTETNEIRFNNNLSTTGNGFSFQLGAIAKVSEGLRLGASYESPTWYSIYEETTQYLETNNSLNERVVVNPNIINVYPNYTLKTPQKLTGSAAILFGNAGLISFDYSYKDYTEMEFRPLNDPDFRIQNADISETMKAVNIYRVGAEIRISKLSLRGGYRYEESPYVDETILGPVTGYSGGLGFNFGGVKLDLAYTQTEFEEGQPLYQVGLTDRATITRDLSSVVLSLSFGL